MLGGAIDRAEMAVTSGTPFANSGLARLVATTNGDLHLAQRHGYNRAFDLRGHGIDAILYRESRFTGADKVQVIKAGEKYYGQIIGVLESIFAVEVSRLRITRMDLCVDVPGLPIRWFYEHVIAPRKRNGG